MSPKLDQGSSSPANESQQAQSIICLIGVVTASFVTFSWAIKIVDKQKFRRVGRVTWINGD